MSSQSNQAQTVPIYNAQRLIEFQNFLLQSNVVNYPGTPKVAYPDHSKLLVVNVSPPPNFPIGQCWYNCIEYSLHNDGQIVYGWLLWEVHKQYYVAQHHAIWRSKNGTLTDLTPNAINAKQVLFMPDHRALFDINIMRAPSSLEWMSNDEYQWVAGGRKHIFVWLMEMKSDNYNLTQRIAKLRSALAGTTS